MTDFRRKSALESLRMLRENRSHGRYIISLNAECIIQRDDPWVFRGNWPLYAFSTMNYTYTDTAESKSVQRKRKWRKSTSNKTEAREMARGSRGPMRRGDISSPLPTLARLFYIESKIDNTVSPADFLIPLVLSRRKFKVDRHRASKSIQKEISPLLFRLSRGFST